MLAQTHEFWGSGYRNDGPDHAVDRGQALAMWTRDAARTLAWEGIGSVNVGGWADLVVVDRDPLNCDLSELADTVVLKTLLAGQTVYERDSL